MEGVREGRGYVSVEFRGRGGRYWSGKGREKADCKYEITDI